MAAVRITVGASSDGSMRTVFRPMVEAARSARAVINSEFQLLGAQIGVTFKGIAGKAQSAFSAVTDAEKKELEKQVAQVKDAEEKKRKARDESARAEGGYGGGPGRTSLRDNGYRTALGTVRYADRMVRGAGHTAMDIAKGAGVDLNLGSLIGQSVKLGKMATDLSNAAWQPNNPNPNDPSTKRVPVSEIIADARAAGNKTALDPMMALEGMQNFTAVSGDLDTARKIIGDLGVLARSTGTDFDAMVTAAGEANSKLDGVSNRGAVTMGVMRALAGQGKLASVEIKHLAVEMAKVGSVAKNFDMAPEQAMTEMGILMQQARATGGAKTASVAANSAMAFVQTLTKGTTIKNLQAAGIQPFADKEKTKILGPETMILASLYKTKGDLQQLGGIYKDIMAMRAVRGFATIYNEKKGTQEEKLDAVRARFAELRGAKMGDSEIKDSFAKSMDTDEARIQLFNNKLSEIGAEIAGKVLPAMNRLAPTILSGVEAFGKFVAWAAENPGKALATALAASIARASIDSVIRTGIEKLFDRAQGRTGGGEGAGGGGVGNKVGAALGLLGTGLVIASAAVTINSVGEMLIDKVLKERAAERDKAENDQFSAENAERVRKAAASGRGGAQEIEVLAKRRDALLSRLDSVRDARAGGILGALKNTITGEEGGFSGYKSAKADAKNEAAMAAEAQNLTAAINQLIEAQARSTDKVQKVQIVGGGPTADTAGTSPAGGK